ncbi:MAG: UDP-N-acetylmuramoyl-L-alanine--D-glutamate ligase [Candidatus Omnitrophota bacterium]
MDLRHKRVAIIGSGKSGMAIAELVLHFQGQPKISEKAPQESLKNILEKWPQRKRVEMEFGGHTRKFIEESDMVVLSPGVPISAEPVAWAKAKDISVFGEVELAFRFCPCPVIAVTGSNGKTTVSTLIAKVLEETKRKVCLCGNIGSPFSSHVTSLKKNDLVVLEISSFQLESIIHFRPHVAVFVNFSQNHLDRHKDMEEYLCAKKRIFSNQKKNDFAILNYEDPIVKNLASEVQSKVSYFNSPGLSEKLGIRNPNHLAAAEVGRIFDVSPDQCKKIFSGFKGVEHRLELVRTIDGVDFVNDSKSTTPEAGRWALTTMEKPIVMICGGYDKKLGFDVLSDLVGRKVKRIFAIGQTKEKITKAFSGVVNVEECGNLESAVVSARRAAVPGDCVLLSPMCASFDMFKNFEERGKVFKQIVSQL